MKTKELIRLIAKKSKISQKDVGDVYSAMADIIIDNVKQGEEVQLRRLGIFFKNIRKSRNGVHPLTLEKMIIPEIPSVAFKVSINFRKKLKIKNK